MHMFMLSKYRKNSPPKNLSPVHSHGSSSSFNDIEVPESSLPHRSRLIRWIPKEVPAQPRPKDQLRLENSLKTAKASRTIEQNYNYLAELHRKDLEKKKLELELKIAKAKLAKEYADSLRTASGPVEQKKKKDKQNKDIKSEKCHKCNSERLGKNIIAKRCMTCYYKWCCKFFCFLSTFLLITFAVILIAF